MIKGYFRPDSLSEALDLLLKSDQYLPIGGGSTLKTISEDIFVLDLQKLGLDKIKKEENRLIIGATTKLQTILQYFGELSPISKAIAIEASKNQRDQSTIGGLIYSSDGRSPFLTLLLGLNVELVWEPGSLSLKLGDWLPVRDIEPRKRILLSIAIEEEVVCRFLSVGRSPLDRPIICVAARRWRSGRLRIAVGGFGQFPTLVLDGFDTDDYKQALASALQEADDGWSSAEYRIATSQVLAARIIVDLQEGKRS